ncbi:MAG: hypothetical protein A2579_00535 [Lysobacterales bacterium RIFOXYD1_FULL_69_11]|nr:MAG: hypothetical protein A2190_00695 [Xanthomonadales bacterium RIFOXYA1_FULL_69_10]OHE86371.1 MAG: hypothetical protein A2579_00535 [Xanthomonadales bacterium RIFOXYD1_FULL_69_11]
MILVTGSAGFIGAHVVQRLLAMGHMVVGIDNHNSYYDPGLKARRLEALTGQRGYIHVRGDIAAPGLVAAMCRQYRPRGIVHLAAQAGVRHSLVDPHAYVESNLVGFVNVLEAARHHAVDHFVYASSSSVYGEGGHAPLAEDAPTDRPLSLYGATKKANELIAYSYAHLYAMRCTGLRFFTVYGPWGRPDMAPMLFANAILDGSPVVLFNHGHNARSFTYIDDIVDGVVRVLQSPAEAPAGGPDQARVFNIGNPVSTPLPAFVSLLSRALGRKARLQFAPPAAADATETTADTRLFEATFGPQQFTALDAGLGRLAHWVRSERAQRVGRRARSGRRTHTGTAASTCVLRMDPSPEPGTP